MTVDTAVMDMDEALRTLGIVGKLTDKIGHLDIFMKVKTQRAGDVEGESPRKFADGKPRHQLLGYYFSAGSPTDVGSGAATGRRRYSAVRVVRNSDAATASLLSAFSTNDKVTVEVSSYKAGGSDTAQPSFRMELGDARVKSYTLIAGGALYGSGAMDIIEFVFRTVAIDTAPQTASGQRGAVRSFMDEVP